MVILLFGSTGFLGSELLRALLPSSDVSCVILPVRRLGPLAPEERIASLCKKWLRFHLITATEEAAFQHKMHVLPWESWQENLEPWKKRISHVIHCAAATEFNLPYQQSYRNNVVLTEELLQFSETLPQLQYFVHFSTSFVCGKSRGEIQEEHFSRPKGFYNPYEETKWLAEERVRRSHVPYMILRPSIVVGESTSGYVPQFKVLYSLWRFWLYGYLPRMPFNLRARIDMVPSDYVVRVALKLMTTKNAQNRTFHICAGEKSVKASTILAAACEVFQVAYPKLIPLWLTKILLHPWVYWLLGDKIKKVVEVLKEHLAYMDERHARFSTAQLETVISKEEIQLPSFEDYGKNLFRFCRDTKWGKT